MQDIFTASNEFKTERERDGRGEIDPSAYNIGAGEIESEEWRSPSSPFTVIRDYTNNIVTN